MISFYRSISLIAFLLVGFSLTSFRISDSEGKPNSDGLLKADSLAIDDGPYVFITREGLEEKTIVKGELITDILAITAFKTDYSIDPSYYSGIMKIAALSDIHGQYDLAIEILQNNKIIDKKLHWNFGKGHLVIVGDIFDRGPKVTEMLWFVYHLEREAKAKGGKVHFLMGNHEYMVLRNDLRYLNEKYDAVAEKMGIGYDQLYNDQTVLGRWLRSKSTFLKIDDNLFVHAGVSPEFMTSGTNLDSLNSKMRASIDVSKEALKSTSFYNDYYGSDGPIWYRGYFKGGNIEAQIDSILSAYDVNHIIVGHTSQKKIEVLYNYRVLAVDTSIKKGKKGQILFIEKGKFYKGTKKGKRKRL